MSSRRPVKEQKWRMLDLHFSGLCCWLKRDGAGRRKRKGGIEHFDTLAQTTFVARGCRGLLDAACLRRCRWRQRPLSKTCGRPEELSSDQNHVHLL